MASLYFATSRKCNLRCKYCYISEQNKSEVINLNGVEHSFYSLVNKIKKEKTPIDRIVFHGAESTLVPPYVYEHMMKYCSSILGESMAYGFQTNGTLLEEFHKLFVGKNVHFSISLDVGRDAHNAQRGGGTYEKVLSNIKLLKGKGFSLSVISVVTNYTTNIEVIREHVDMLQDIGVGCELKIVNLSAQHEVSFEEGFKLGRLLWTTGLYRHIQSVYRGICHNRGNECFFIECDYLGNVFSCNHEFGDGEPFGEWKNTSFEELVKKRYFVYQSALYSADCVSCPWFTNCHGGCPITRVKDKADDCSIRLGILHELRHTNLTVNDIMLERAIKNKRVSNG